jgi:MFS family permease
VAMALERRATLGAAALSFFVRCGFGLILPGLPLYIRAHGIAVPDLGLASAAYMAFGLGGMLLLAPLADRLGHVRALVAGGILYLCGTLVLLALPSAASLLAGRALQGLAMALTTPATYAYIADRVAAERRGGAYGTVTSAQMAGFIVGPAAGGLALSLGGVSAALTVALVASLLALGTAVSLPAGVPATTPVETADRAEDTPAPTPLGALAAVAAAPWGLAFVAYTIGQQIPMGVYDTVWSLYMFHLGAHAWLVGASFATWALPLVVLSPLVGRRVAPGRVLRWLVVGGFVMALSAFTYALLRNPYAVAAMGVIEGCGAAAAIPLSNVYLAARVPAGRMAGAQGVIGAVGQGAALFAAVASGYTFAVRPWLPFCLAAVGCAAGTLWFYRREGSTPARRAARESEEGVAG